MNSPVLLVPPSFCALALCAVLPCCAELQATTPAPRLVAADGTPVVGRIRFRDETIDLTRSTIAADGAAHDVARSVALIIADVDRFSNDSPMLRVREIVPPSAALDTPTGLLLTEMPPYFTATGFSR